MKSVLCRFESSLWMQQAFKLKNWHMHEDKWWRPYTHWQLLPRTPRYWSVQVWGH
jgi:hypothetical protein